MLCYPINPYRRIPVSVKSEIQLVFELLFESEHKRIRGGRIDSGIALESHPIIIVLLP